jgi:hypothetical protein
MRCQSSIDLSLRDPFGKMRRFPRTTEALGGARLATRRSTPIFRPTEGNVRGSK